MLEGLTSWIETSGWLIYVLAPLFTVTVAVLPFPAEIPALLNGMAFGPLWGSLVTWVCALCGAQISFELARRFGRPLGERLVRPALLERADRLVAAAGWPVLLTLRLIPTVAFTAVNWAAGLTLLRRSTFIWTTAVGILPGAVAFTATGSGIEALISREASPGWLPYAGAGVVVLLAVGGWTWWRYSVMATEIGATEECPEPDDVSR